MISRTIFARRFTVAARVLASGTTGTAPPSSRHSADPNIPKSSEQNAHLKHTSNPGNQKAHSSQSSSTSGGNASTNPSLPSHKTSPNAPTQTPKRTFHTSSIFSYPSEKQDTSPSSEKTEHTPDTYNKASSDVPPSTNEKTNVVEDSPDNDKVSHAHDAPGKGAYTTVSSESPYQPKSGDQKGENLRYGNTSKHNGGPEEGVAKEHEGPEGSESGGRKPE
ncbi:hypothetical protein SISSUDRAFT_1065002 [Sistotremastrum suecicum HHB10207 ss-3]|uniref:Uncharacterized protein n=1 Tax=Sistotremastrum suecicum HHB10207 ss-3 TaxID=1314776 RepID=A0A166A053_9AGAM|nr:hypothetical protein SISSUDRAFT_1065002 [Sistotremastrum suecicum HHB10207 ss-3]